MPNFIKAALQIFTLVILTSSLAHGQVMDTIIQKMIDCSLIEQKEAKEFDTLLKKSNFASNLAYLAVLTDFEFRKLSEDTLSANEFYLSFVNFELDAERQAFVNAALTAYLLKLKNCYLIDDSQYLTFQTKISNNVFDHPLSLLFSICYQDEMSKLTNSKELNIFADKLKDKEIVSIHYEKLIADIQQEKLLLPIEFIRYCDRRVFIIEHDYPNEPEKYLELIHQKSASLFPELAFTDFEFRVFLDSSDYSSDFQSYYFAVSLKSNGTLYKQKSHYRSYSTERKEYTRGKIDEQEYYIVFNKILADLKSPYRLHLTKMMGDVFVLIALTKEQADLLHRSYNFFKISYEEFNNTLTSKRIEQSIEEYKKIGLLSHLTPEQIEKAKETISEQENSNLNDVLMAFPEIIYFFDTEMENLDDPYAELLREYKKIAHNDFNPTDISDNFAKSKGNHVEVKFTLENKPYNKTLQIDSDWIDPEFCYFIVEVVTENNLKGQFYQLYTGGQEASVIYLTKAQYEYIRANKLLIFADEKDAEED